MAGCSAMMILHAETPLHPGTGSAVGAIDLPVAREKATGWPLVPGSSLKGVLRDAARRAKGATVKGSAEWAIFGPETADASDHAGALSITDARLLAMPLRSLAGLFAWATCAAALERLVRDARVAGINNEVSEAAAALLKEAAPPRAKNKEALVAKGSPLLVKGAAAGQANLVFEEFDYNARESEAVARLGAALDAALGEGMRLATHLAVISDDAFGFSARHATEVSARIKLDPKTKTVQGGALFYEEFVPAGTLFCALALAESPKCESEVKDAAGVLAHVRGVLEKGNGVIQVGGDATIGKGLCTAVLLDGKGA